LQHRPDLLRHALISDSNKCKRESILDIALTHISYLGCAEALGMVPQNHTIEL
jgi:hypothetical protein